MTGYLLIRHASADHVGRRLAGREPGVHLDERGRAEAAALARLLADTPLATLHTSPRERATETARPIAHALGLEPVVDPAFDEIDFGAWSGRTLDALEGDPEWEAWNRFRSTARPPGGETMAEVLARALDGVRALGAAHPDAWVAVVTHCDVIRPLLAHFAGMPLDLLLRLEVGTASVSAIELHPWGPRILAVNGGPAGPWVPRTG
ncbi:MAG: histidine phosphatase family protein [Gemmatimonadota bacterium]